MKLAFASLKVHVTKAKWTDTIHCNGDLVDNEVSVGTFTRTPTDLVIVLRNGEIHLVGNLPNTKYGGSGILEWEKRQLASFTCPDPSTSWQFTACPSGPNVLIEIPGIADKLTGWGSNREQLVKKFQYLLRSNIEIHCNGICLRSPSFEITDRPLLNDEEQKVFNEILPLETQIQVLCGIVLVQTTFGVKFVT